MADAILGAIVGQLLTEVINLTKLAYHCKRNCKVLLTTLESVSPLLDQVTRSADISNVTCQAWLESMRVVLTDAKGIVQMCSQKKAWGDFVIVKRAKLFERIMDIDNQIRKKLLESNLITLDIVQAINNHMMVTPSASNAAMQDTPSKIVPFVNDLLEKLKKIIMSVAQQMEAPTTIGWKGRGGAGKTLLAKMVNNDEDIRSEYASNSILWITVGRDATVQSLYLTMAKLIGDGGVYERDHKHRNLEDQRGYLLTLLREKKVLLILDDVWDSYPANGLAMIEWLDVAKGLGLIIVVTTQELAVLRRGKAKVKVEVGSLAKDERWELFCFHAFGSMGPPSSVIEDIAKEVCEECDGLPLAVVVIGSAMYEKDNDGEWRRTLNYLKGFVSTLNSKSDERVIEQKLYNCLKYSYEELDDVSKKCFLYFAAYPEDAVIHSRQLCAIWSAEQLFGCLSAEESNNIGWSTLVDLEERSLIIFCDKFGDGWLLSIHDVLQDLAIRILRHATPNAWPSDCFFQPGKVFDTFPMIEKTTKRLSLVGCSFKELPSKLELPCLEVCLLSRISSVSQESLEIPRGFLSSMNALSMLDMSYTIDVDWSLLNFEGLKSLKHLDLSCCGLLTSIPKSIGELKSLTHLDLSSCMLGERLDSIGELKSLTHLDLSNCWCSENVIESIGELKSLTHLDLSSSVHVQNVHESIGELKSLTHLDLSNCSTLRSIPESIGELKSLTHLDLSRCDSLQNVLESIGELKSLTHLDLSRCDSLQNVPKSIGELKSLTHLDLSYCHMLTSISKSIGELKSLTHLDLSRCRRLQNVPESIGELKSLTHLDLSRCKRLQNIPESIGELKSLTHLDLSNCSTLTSIPKSIGELKSLTHLDLSRCRRLQNVPESIGELKSLTHLDLSNCSTLTSIPKSIGELKSLTHLDLSNCSTLTSIPKSIGELKSLTHLDLSRCRRLQNVPESIGELKSLTHLDLSRCKRLQNIPESIGELKSLTHLDLSNCSTLTSIPESIGELKSLTH